MAEGDGLTLILILVIGTMAMLILAIGIFFFFITYQKRLLAKELEVNQIKTEQQKELLRTAIFAQENERKRFAEDLHDEIGAILSAIKLNLNRLEKKSTEDSIRSIASDTKNNIDEVIFHIRRITRALLPPSLESFGLGQAIRELIFWIDQAEANNVKFSESGDISRFDQMKEMTIFRIVQELLNNALKYSGASLIEIHLKYSRNYLCVLISDNGSGFDVVEARGRGLGLQNLEGRANVINARIKIKSRIGKGTSAILLNRLD